MEVSGFQRTIKTSEKTSQRWSLEGSVEGDRQMLRCDREFCQMWNLCIFAKLNYVYFCVFSFILDAKH